jgi:hypothetical protein
LSVEIPVRSQPIQAFGRKHGVGERNDVARSVIAKPRYLVWRQADSKPHAKSVQKVFHLLLVQHRSVFGSPDT